MMFQSLAKIKKWWDNLPSSSQPKNAITLEPGTYDPKIFGADYSQSLLKALFQSSKGGDILLTLTPICDYQIKNKWPEPPFVNVNLFGSIATEKNNWLGYIPIDDPTEVDFAQIIQKYGNVNVHAKIQKSGHDFYISLQVSKKYRYDESKIIKTYVSYDSKQIAKMEKLSCESGRDYIKVTMQKTADNQYYAFVYKNKILGTASSKKIDNKISGIPKYRMYLSIKKFRFDDDSDNKHYSALLILPEL